MDGILQIGLPIRQFVAESNALPAFGTNHKEQIIKFNYKLFCMDIVVRPGYLQRLSYRLVCLSMWDVNLPLVE